MKRTLTAAATLLAGSAGAVGFAGTAAADTPELPAELPVDNNLAQTVYHAAGTLHSSQAVVGDVVPTDQQLTGRAAQPVDGAQDLLGGALAGTVGDLAGGALGGQTGDVLGNTPQGNSPQGEATGGQLPVGGDLLGGVTGRSASPAGALPTDNLPVAGQLPTENLPVAGQLPVGGDVLGGVTGRSASPAGALPTENLPVAGQLPTGNLPVGDVVTRVTGTLPVG